MQIKTKIVSCHTADSKPVKQEVNSVLSVETSKLWAVIYYILVNALTVLLVWADPLLTLVCGLGHLDGVEHQVDFVGSRDHSD